MNVERWIELYGAAWRDRDVEAVLKVFTEDAVYRSHPFREPHVGHAGIRAYWEGAVGGQAEIDLRFGRAIVEDGRAAVEWWATYLDEREEETLAGILYLRFAEDGRCFELREAWTTQPGRRPPHEGWGS
jgi:ketosteroid isomerase-like protein